MKFSTVSCLLSSAAGALAASAGHVFLLDSATSSRPATHHDTVDPETAQLIFAHRLGLSSFYDLPTDTQTLSRLNAFGGRPKSLLRVNRPWEDSQEASRVLVVVDDVDSAIDLMPSSEHAAFFDISPAPHPYQTETLLGDFVGQLQQGNNRNPNVLNEFHKLSTLGNSCQVYSGGSVVHIKSIKTSARSHGRSSSEYKAHVAEVRDLLQRLTTKLHEPEDSLTIVMMPPEADCAKKSDKSYRLVARTPNAARQPIEAPLSEGVSRVVSTIESTSADVEEQLSTYKNKDDKKSNNTLPRGPIPSYFTSKAACERTTNNCTGHGSCVAMFKDTDNKNQDVFGCKCVPHVAKNNGQSKTTRYSGAACNKKDVSVEFWLLAGTTVFLLFIVSMGMALLYSMGNEELPSVLGAGVSGPRATK